MYRPILAPMLAALAAPAGAQLDYGTIARETLAAYGHGDGAAEELDLDSFLDGPGFLRVPLGGLDVRFPAEHAGESGHVRDLARIGQDLLEMQRHWIRWTAGPDAELEEIEKDLDTLAKWIKRWSARKLGRADGADGEDLLAQLKARDREREAARRLAEVFATGRPIGVERVEGEGPARLVLVPTREGFIRLATVGGLLSPADRSLLWHESIVNGMAFWVGTGQVVAMEYAAYPIDLRAPFQGYPMDDSKTRQRQHAVDRGAASLLRTYLYRLPFHFFESALAANLVIATCGENDLALLGHQRDYKRPGQRTAPYQRFVPGGNPGGGVLPPRSAGGRRGGGVSAKNIPDWFRDLGRDHFAEALHDAQRAGAKRASRADSGLSDELRRNRLAHFEISSRTSGRETIVSAPFFGPEADGKALPEDEFLDDYEDFFSSYRACFFHWIQRHGAGDDEKACARRFSELLRGLTRRSEERNVRAVIEEVYGLPVSAPSGEADSLEWRFLAWLSEQG